MEAYVWCRVKNYFRNSTYKFYLKSTITIILFKFLRPINKLTIKNNKNKNLNDFIAYKKTHFKLYLCNRNSTKSTNYWKK